MIYQKQQNNGIIDFLKENHLLHKFCPVPFTSMILNPNGDVGCCREKGTMHVVGSIKKQTLEEIWNSEAMQSWRQEFLSGNIVTCARDMEHKSCHLLAPNQDIIPFIQLETIQKTPPLRLSPDFNSFCNLRCSMCHIWQGPNGLYDEIDFWPYAEKNLFPHLMQMDPLSGEPFLQKDLYRLIDFMAANNPDCEWRFTTNGHWEFTQQIRDSLDKIRIRFISISLDSINPNTYRKIRKADISKTLTTIDCLLSYSEERNKNGNPIKILLNFTIQKDNWREIKEHITFTLDKGAEPFIQFLYNPPELSLSAFSNQEKRQCLDFYLNDLTPTELAISHRVFKSVADECPELEKNGYLRFFNVLTSSFFSRTRRSP